MNEQLPMPLSGTALRDIGIAQAVDHAEAETPGWVEMAIEYLKKYPKKELMAEELRKWAHQQGLPSPPHARAWGSVIIVARKRGLISHAGYRNTENPKSHATPASVWLKAD